MMLDPSSCCEDRFIIIIAFLFHAAVQRLRLLGQVLDLPDLFSPVYDERLRGLQPQFHLAYLLISLHALPHPFLQLPIRIFDDGFILRHCSPRWSRAERSLQAKTKRPHPPSTIACSSARSAPLARPFSPPNGQPFDLPHHHRIASTQQGVYGYNQPASSSVQHLPQLPGSGPPAARRTPWRHVPTAPM